MFDNFSAKCEPRKPATPVINIFFINLILIYNKQEVHYLKVCVINNSIYNQVA